MARDYAHIINEHDGKLTDRQFINDLYGQSRKNHLPADLSLNGIYMA